MDAIVHILALQSLLASFDGFLRELSLHVCIRHYLLIAGFLFCCGCIKLSTRLAIAVFISGYTFIIMKQFFQSPRPYWLDDRVFMGINESGFRMPSGHTQNTVVFFGLLAWSIKNRWVTLCCLVMVALVGVSRVYLGKHAGLLDSASLPPMCSEMPTTGNESASSALNDCLL